MCPQPDFRAWRKHFFSIVLAWASLTGSGEALGRTFAFDFQYHPKEENLALFDFTIVDPMAEVDVSIAHKAGKKVIAYISVTEVAPDAWYRDEALATVAVKWTNPFWNSSAMDISDPRWAQFVVNRLARNAVERGFDGFFLDTVDSYWDLGDRDPANRDAYYNGAANIIKAIKAAYPDKELISNRGFEIYNQIKDSIDGIALESLFRTYDEDGRFVPTLKRDTDELLAFLEPIKGKMPIYVIDYVDRADIALAKETADRLIQAGFHPLVGPKSHDGTVLAPDPREGSSLPPPVQSRPVIVKHPQSASKTVGANVTFKVVATGADLTYQWQWKGVDIPDATDSKLVLSSVKMAWAGAYRVVVKNTGGEVTSKAAVLKVTKKSGGK